MDNEDRISFYSGGYIDNGGKGQYISRDNFQVERVTDIRWIVSAGISLGVSHVNIDKFVSAILMGTTATSTPGYVYKVMVEEAYKLEIEDK